MKKKFIPAMHFPLLTPVYDWFSRVFLKNVYSDLIRIIHVPPQSKLIDIGCGPGTMTMMLHKKHPKAHITGLDIDPEILSYAEKKIRMIAREPTIDLMTASATDIPCDDNTFDVAVSSLMIHHLSKEQRKKMSEEIVRILKPGAVFYLFDFGPPRSLLSTCASKLYRLFEDIDDGTRGNYQKYLKQSGFVNIQPVYEKCVAGMELQMLRCEK